jgi:hypothetical protein
VLHGRAVAVADAGGFQVATRDARLIVVTSGVLRPEAVRGGELGGLA